MRRILPLFLVLAFVPTAVSALTLQEVVTLSKAGVSEEVLLTMIERDHTIFAIDADQVIVLQRDGVSERILIALLKSGRQDPPAPAPPDAASFVPSEPILVMVGHGPDHPHVYNAFDRLDSPGAFNYPTGIVVVPWFVAPPLCNTGRVVPTGSARPSRTVVCRRSR